MPIDNGRNLEARQRLIAALRTGRLLAATGAGVSAWAGYGTWRQVLRHLADAVENYSRGAIPDAGVIIRNNPDPLNCARQLGIHLGPRFAEFIRNEFGPNDQAPHDVIYRIVNLPFTHFLSFNFDIATESVHRALRRDCGTVSTSSQHEFLKFMREMESNGYYRRVVHLHGIYSDPPELMALTNQGYARLYRNVFFTNALWSLLVSKQLVFLGFGFNDRAVLEALTRAAWDIGEEEDPHHFAVIGLWPDEEDGPQRNTHTDTYKIEPVFYEIRGDRDNPDHGGFVELINGISAELGAPAAEPISTPEIPRVAIEPDPHDLHRAQELGDAFIERTDPGGNDVQG